MEVGTNVSLALRIRNGHRRAFPNVTETGIYVRERNFCGFVLRVTRYHGRENPPEKKFSQSRLLIKFAKLLQGLSVKALALETKE